MVNIDGISKEELEAAKKAAQEDMKNDKANSSNKKTGHTTKKSGTNLGTGAKISKRKS